MEDDNDLPRPPYFIQHGPNPLFQSEEDLETDFSCSECHNVLIEGYRSECFIGIGFQCSRCGNISWTPKLEPGEILPLKLANMGSRGHFRAEGPIPYSRELAIVNDDELEAEMLAAAPRAKANKQGLGSALEWINAIEAEFEELSGVPILTGIQKLRRYQAGETGSRLLPFHWSVSKFRDCIDVGALDLSDHETNVALSRLLVFSQVTSSWRHHPRFATIAAELANPTSYFHTLGIFVVAGHYFEHGQTIGFSVKDAPGHPKPDLYIRTSAGAKFYLEVKCPLRAIWEPNKQIAYEEFRKNLRSTLKDSSQISRDRPGAMVIVLNHPDLAIRERAEFEIKQYLDEKGQSKRSLAAVVVLHCGTVSRDTEKTPTHVSVDFHFSNILNPHAVERQDVNFLT